MAGWDTANGAVSSKDAGIPIRETGQDGASGRVGQRTEHGAQPILAASHLHNHRVVQPAECGAARAQCQGDPHPRIPCG